jgi:hypothetical protein
MLMYDTFISRACGQVFQEIFCAARPLTIGMNRVPPFAKQIRMRGVAMVERYFITKDREAAGIAQLQRRLPNSDP